LAGAAVVGSVERGAEEARRLLAAPAGGEEAVALLRLRALLRGFAGDDFEGARRDLEEVLRRRPGDRWARYRRAQLRVRVGSARYGGGDPARREEGERLLRKAIEECGRLLGEDPDFHAARLVRGAAHFALQDLIGAKADFRYVAERDPRRKEVYLHEAALHRLSYVRSGETGNLSSLRAAIEILARALEIDPNYFDALYEMGNLNHVLFDQAQNRQLRSRAYGAALLFYKRAMAVNPRSRAPRVEYATLCLKVAREARQTGRLEGADKMIERAETRAGDLPDVAAARVRLNLSPGFATDVGRSPQQVLDEAEAALKRLEALRPEDPGLPRLRWDYHHARGWFYYLTWVRLRDARKKARAKDLAVEHWRRALEAEPDHPDGNSIRRRLRELAPQEMGRRDREEARRALEAGNRALAEESWEEAERSFRRAVALFPAVPSFRYGLGVSLARQDRRREALAQLQPAANSAEAAQFPEIFVELGRIYILEGKRRIAHAWLRRFVTAMEAAGRGAEAEVERVRKLLARAEGG
ncbi:MAG: hypothetical protein ACE5JG_02390, partial [Planctomycetota bacterium]